MESVNMGELLDKLLIELKERRGVDFRAYRRQTLESQLAARMTQLQHGDGDAYLARFRNDPNECDALLGALVINVSRFFRNPIVFEILAQRVLSELLEKKLAAGHRELRIWSAGCASGEEPYSVAILLKEAFDLADWSIHIFATDIDEAALEQARSGRYAEDRLEEAKSGIVRKYFRPSGDAFEIHPEIRNMVLFSRHDLTSAEQDAPAESVFGGFDLILCRNVLIYLNPSLQLSVCEKLARSLNSGGCLVLGKSEHLPRGMTARLSILGDLNRIYRKHA